MSQTIGGGAKKVMYTLQTAAHIGLLNATKALAAKNACKACGLGMGGQKGGMTNEMGEFPSVCNKSLQAQSTDIQPPIPVEIFQHPISELKDLSAHQLEHLGRLGQPIYKAADSNYFKTVDWDWAITHAADKLAAIEPDQSFFYSSGRSSNEAGFLLQLVARLYGTNNISNCSFYCHQATGEGLKNTIGTGTSTVKLEDIDQADLFFLIGANPASNHPRLMHKLIQLKRRGGKVIVINPMREAGLLRFAAPKMMTSMLKGGDDIADIYLQPKIGEDIALFQAIAKGLLESGSWNTNYLQQHCEGAGDLEDQIGTLNWDDLTRACQVPLAEISAATKTYAQAKNVIFAWGMGMTHHQHGVGNIEWISNLALIRGMIGKPGAGLLPLRGHSNVQGIGTIGVKPVLAKDVLASIEAEFGIDLPTKPGLHTLASLEAAHAGNMKCAVLMGGNLLAATPDTKWAIDAFDRIDFKLALTTTLNRGHVMGTDNSESLILPVCARDEEPEPTTQESMFNFVRLSDGGIERIATVRSEVAILSDLATVLLDSAPIDFQAFKSHRNIRSAISRTIPGMASIKALDESGAEFHIEGRIKHSPTFNTPAGKAKLVTTPSTSNKGLKSDRFTLMTIRSEGQFNSIIYEMADTYRDVQHRWILHMNQQDALELGVNGGDLVTVTSSAGTMEKLEVNISPLPRHCVAAYYPEANILTTRLSDPRSHTPAFKSVAVTIERS
jgi:molybdopterin-dependent oxidoreductase alpha subunit